MKLAKFGLAFIPHIFYKGDKGLEKGLSKYFKDPQLRKLWSSEEDLLSCLIPIAWGYNKDYQLPPKGGGQVFPEWLAHVIGEFGNEIFYQTRVTKIVYDGKVATHLIADRKGQELKFSARYFVAACDVETLYERMLGPEITNPKFLRKLRSAKLYSSAVTLSIGLDCPSEELGFGDELMLIQEEGIKRDEHDGGDPYISDISILAPTVRDKTMAPQDKGTLTIYVPAYFYQYNNWGTSQDDKGNLMRGEEYKRIKSEYADIILNRVEKELGMDIRSHIEFMDIATPVTHYRYTGNKDGTMMGARPCKENFQARISHYKTPLGNVFLSGHWANLGGGVPIAVSTAANSTLLVLQKENKDLKPLEPFLMGKFQWKN